MDDTEWDTAPSTFAAELIGRIDEACEERDRYKKMLDAANEEIAALKTARIESDWLLTNARVLIDDPGDLMGNLEKIRHQWIKSLDTFMKKRDRPASSTRTRSWSPPFRRPSLRCVVSSES